MMGGGSRRHGPGAMMKGDKAVNFKDTMRKLLEYLKDYKFKLVVVIIFAIASTAFTIVGPKILGNATKIGRAHV